jgi:hypothetical protein
MIATTMIEVPEAGGAFPRSCYCQQLVTEVTALYGEARAPPNATQCEKSFPFVPFEVG